MLLYYESYNSMCCTPNSRFPNLITSSKRDAFFVTLNQANEEHEELLRARDSIIAALQSSLSAKDLEMEVIPVVSFICVHS